MHLMDLAFKSEIKEDVHNVQNEDIIENKEMRRFRQRKLSIKSASKLHTILASWL